MNNHHDKIRTPPKWLPISIAIFGILMSLLLWFSLNYEAAKPIIIFLHQYIDVLLLSLGISLAILVAFAIRLLQISRKQLMLYSQIKQDFLKEIAERMEIENSKQKLEKALLQGQKLQAIGTLAGGIAHDFNNILYAIKGYVDMAREDVAKDSITYKNLGKVIEASHRGEELIARILAFSRHQHLNFQPLPVIETIDGVLALLKPTIPASVVIDFQKKGEEMTILGDKTQLHQVIVNIINNAVDAMDGEGEVTISIQPINKSDKLLQQFPDLTKSHYCMINITDTGYGMDQTTLGRIFEPFFTTKEVGKGTGLGLSTVHTIIEDHEGKIFVNSRLGFGTTFSVLLPVYKELADG